MTRLVNRLDQLALAVGIVIFLATLAVLGVGLPLFVFLHVTGVL